MNILAVNDDGYDSDGIIYLCAALKKKGHRVVVMAPDGQRSGFSHSFSFAKGFIDIKKVADDVWKCSGTPVDCVSMVLLGAIDFKPEIVVSGINSGCNMGTDILFSGTDGAARHAALGCLPAVAFSLSGESSWEWEAASEWAACNLDSLLALWHKDIFVNVNIPNTRDFEKKFYITFPAKRQYSNAIKPEPIKDGWVRINISDLESNTLVETGSDVTTVEKNRVSVSLVYIHPIVTEKSCPSAPRDRKICL